MEKQLQEIDITYATEKQKVVSIDEAIRTIQKRIEKFKEEKSKSEETKKEIIENDYSLTVNSYIEHLTQKEEIDIWANTYSLIASSIHNIVRNTEFIICIDECIDYL